MSSAAAVRSRAARLETPLLEFVKSDFVFEGRVRPGAVLEVAEEEESRERARASSVERSWMEVEEREMALVLDLGRGAP